MADVTTKVGVEGAQQYKTKMAELTSSAKRLDSEMAVLTSGFDKNTSEAEKNASTHKLLEEQIVNQQRIVHTMSDNYNEMTKKLEALKTAAEKAAQGENANAEEAAKAQQEYNRYQTTVNKAAAELNNAQAKLNQLKNGFYESGKEAEKASGHVSVFGDVLKANLSAKAIEGAVSGLVNIGKNIAKGTAELVLNSAAYADKIITLSSTTGLATDTLQEYFYMAELVDVSVETLTGAQTKLVKTMQSAQSGGKAAAGIFKKLGISIEDGSGALRDFSEVFNEAIASLAGIENETERDATAMELFGKSARELNPLIEADVEALEALRKEAHEAGAVLDSEALEALGAVDNAYQRLKQQWEGKKNDIATALAPSAESLLTAFGAAIDAVPWDRVTGWLNDKANGFGQWVDNIDFDALSANMTAFFDEAIQGFQDFAALMHQIKTEGLASVLFPDTLEGEITDVNGVLQDTVDIMDSLDQAARDNGLNGATEAMGDAATEAARLVAMLNGTVFPALDKAEETASAVGNEIGNSFVENVAEGVESSTPKVEGAAKKTTDATEILLSQLKGSMYFYGKDAMLEYAGGIRDYKDSVLTEVDALTKELEARLHHSTPDKGPLKNDDTWMPDMMISFARGISENQWRVAEAAENAAAAMAAPILMNRQQMQTGAQVGHDNAEILEAIRGVGGSMQTTVVLEGDARGLFRAVRTENNRITHATGYNKLGRR